MEALTIGSSVTGRKVSGLVLAIAAGLLIYAAMALGSASKAQATNFCTNVTLPAYGSYGDQCYAWPWESGKLIEVGIITHDRAGCVTFAAQNSYDLLDNWSCTAKAGGTWKYAYNDGKIRRGVIRNNNLTYAGTFDGFYGCCYP